MGRAGGGNKDPVVGTEKSLVSSRKIESNEFSVSFVALEVTT